MAGWGSEVIDIPVLRRTAEQNDLILPYQPRKARPPRSDRIDQCNEIEFSSKVHLSEYAAAQNIPAKPLPGKDVARLITARDWAAVEEQCASDVLASAIIAVRHLAAIREIGQTGSACTEAILELFCSSRQETAFVAKLEAWWAAITK